MIQYIQNYNLCMGDLPKALYDRNLVRDVYVGDLGCRRGNLDKFTNTAQRAMSSLFSRRLLYKEDVQG